jgi:hypothetical protein
VNEPIEQQGAALAVEHAFPKIFPAASEPDWLFLV